MSQKIKKQFGIWMDSHHATIVGRNAENEMLSVIGTAENLTPEGNSHEKGAHNAERTLQQKFFKEIAFYLQNAEEVHVTGTGTSQEQFIKFLGETPQYKNVVAVESTANKMSDERLVEYIEEKFS